MSCAGAVISISLRAWWVPPSVSALRSVPRSRDMSPIVWAVPRLFFSLPALPPPGSFLLSHSCRRHDLLSRQIGEAQNLIPVWTGRDLGPSPCPLPRYRYTAQIDGVLPERRDEER